MQGFIQDFVLGEVRGKCVGGGSYLYVLPILQLEVMTILD